MRVLLIADAGDGLLDLGLRARHLGHQVRWFIRKYDERSRPVGRGLLERVGNWREHMQWADVIVLEANGFSMTEFDAWRRRGCLVIGGNQDSADWEIDRTLGMQVFKRAGVPVPPYREFTDYNQAIRFVEHRGEVMYSKPCSETADKSLSAKTGVAENPGYTLHKWKKKHGRPPCPFVLQEAVDGVEFAVGAWFGPAGFAEGFEENHEFKKFCAGDIGQATGEMGTVMRYVRRSKLAEQVLLPCEDQLAALGYVGNVDVNCIIDSDGNAWPLEWTMRLGWPAFNIETDLFDCDPVEFLACLALGEQIRGAHRLNEVAVGIVAVTPPFPHPPRDYDDVVGVPLYGELDEGWHPCELQAGSSDGAEYLTAGDYLGVAVGTGDTVREARTRAYRTMQKISTPAALFYRDDIGERLRRELPKLQEHGFAIGMTYS